MMQGGGSGLRGPQAVPQGGTIQVEIGPNDTEVEVSEAGVGTPTRHPVPPGKTATIPVPNVPGGTLLYVSVGKGRRARIILVEVFALLR